MLKALKSKQAQTIMAEYVLVFFLIVGVATVMTIYFRRAVQARIRDARVTMLDMVRARTNVFVNGSPAYSGPLFAEYEPYYTNSTSSIIHNDFSRSSLTAGGSSGIYTDKPNVYTKMSTFGNTAAPKDADTLPPVGIQ